MGTKPLFPLHASLKISTTRRNLVVEVLEVQLPHRHGAGQRAIQHIARRARQRLIHVQQIGENVAFRLESGCLDLRRFVNGVMAIIIIGGVSKPSMSSPVSSLIDSVNGPCICFMPRLRRKSSAVLNRAVKTSGR